MITRYTSPKVTEPAPELWSNCIVCDGIAYIAGLTSRNADGVTIDGADEYEQTKIIFQKHKGLIEAAGGVGKAKHFRHTMELFDHTDKLHGCDIGIFDCHHAELHLFS